MDSSNVPGYLRTTRALSIRGGYRAAFNGLEVFSAADAEAFLAEKIEAIENAFRLGTQGRELTLDMMLGFAVMTVYADREEKEALSALLTRPKPPMEDLDVDQALEHDSTKPDIIW